MQKNGTVAPENNSRMKSFAKTVMRRLRRLDFKNVHLIPGYEKSEEEYCALKHALNSANIMIKDIMCYEHGNRFLKVLKNGMETLSDKSALNVYKNKDIFEELSMTARRVSMMSIGPECRRSAENFSEAYRKVSESKKRLNSKLESLRLQLKEKRNQCVEIDKSRKKVKNMRYDLEILLQDGGYNGEIRDAEKKEFSTYSMQVLKSMIQFVEDASIGKILASLSKEYAEHLRDASEVLRAAE